MTSEEEQYFAQVQRHLLRSRGMDLTGYSPSFVMRAIRKRIGRSDSESYAAYVKLLLKSEEETNELLNALSINVTEFFRDKGAFETFQAKAIRPLLQQKVGSPGGILRIWSAGCGTGQETYTLAMCLLEEAKDFGSAPRPIMSVVGTDISKTALAKAKRGFYSAEEVKGVPKRLLAEYFQPQGEGYEVTEVLRRHTRFHAENLLDPPSSKFFDAIVCRNVLIYFSRPSHELVLRNLHDALRAGGYLMLGRTEALIGEMRSRYDVVDHENRILRKRA